MLDRCKGELIDFIVGDNRIENAYLLMYRILTNNENKNFNINYRDTLNTIDYLCTDGHNAYEKVANHPLFKHNIKHHIISKSEIQSPSYASLLAITNLLLGKVRTERSEGQQQSIFLQQISPVSHPIRMQTFHCLTFRARFLLSG